MIDCLSIAYKDKYMRKFMQGDEVSYVGSKYAERLAGKLGVICSYVKGTDNVVVVDFPNDKGVDSFIMDESRHLIPYNPALKAKEKKEDRKVRVEKRRPRQEEAEEDEG